MKLHCILVVTTCLLASCVAVSAKTVNGYSSQRNISEKSQTNGEMFLRSLKTEVDDDSNDENDEERVGGALAKVDDVIDSVVLAKIDDVIGGGVVAKADKVAYDITEDTPALVSMFQKWRQQTAKEKLSTPTLVGAPKEQLDKILDLYGLYIALGGKAFREKMERIEAKRIGDAAGR